MKQNNILIVLFLLFMFTGLDGKAVAQSMYIGENETVSLNVPDVSPGYVDKAIWTCSNPAIAFVNKSTIYATIKAVKPFDGNATVELLYVQKYIDSRGFTRAITYTKSFYIRYKYSGSGSTSAAPKEIVVEPELRVALGETVKIPYSILPEGSSAEIWTSCTPGKYFGGIVNYPDEKYIIGRATAVGEESVRLYFYDKNKEQVSSYCHVTVYDPSWTAPESISVPSVVLLKPSESKRLIVKLTPAKANTFFKWSSGKFAVASVIDGLITAKTAGIADIKVKTSEGMTGQCTVVVVPEKDYVPGMKSALKRAADAVVIAETEFAK